MCEEDDIGEVIHASSNTEHMMVVWAREIDASGSELDRTHLLKKIADIVYEYKMFHLTAKNNAT